MAITIDAGDFDEAGEQPGALAGVALVDGRFLGWAAVILGFLIYAILVTPLEAVRLRAPLSPEVARRLTPMKEARLSKARMTGDRVDTQTLAGLICEHWTLMLLLVIPILIVGGRLGRQLGLPGLFRDPPPIPEPDRPRPGPGRGDLHRGHGFKTAGWGAIGATLLVAQVWTTIYYSELVAEHARFDHFHFDTPVTARTLIDYAAGCLYRPAFWNHGELLRFLGLTCWPFLALLFVAEVLPVDAPGLDRRGWAFFREVRRFVLGMVYGAAIVALASILDAWIFHRAMVRFWTWFHPILTRPTLPNPFGRPITLEVPLFKLDAEFPLVPPKVKIALLASHSVFAVTLLTFYGALTQFFRPRLSPGLGICIILGMVGAFYASITLLTTTGQAVVLGPALAWFVACNRDPYKYRFPGMDSYYGPGKAVDLRDLKSMEARAEKVGPLLKGDEVLDRWKAATGREKPKLVLVATTGGAYRASFWTTVVLDELGRCMEGFPRHIRLLTGASGGMVGAAYYAASMTEDGPPPGGVTDLLREESGLDSLTPVVRRLVSRDLPRAFWPTRQQTDRGVTLEEMWSTLATTFPDLIEGERQGWRPSLIVSPMVVESGRRLLFSNLDLGVMTENRAGKRTSEAAPYSRPSVEFFRVFPDSRSTFRLGTAVRMSATFPFASPAVNLPTDPPRRVVDAGYYDNYGVDLASSWIYEHRRWIRRNTSGVALIQVRAYPCAAATLAHLAPGHPGRRTTSEAFVEMLATSFQGLTSPLEGGISAREWSMRFRNASQVRILDDLLNEGHGKPRLFETFVFENFDEFAMNWFLTDADIAGMRRSMHCTESHETSPADRPGGGRPLSPAQQVAKEVTMLENYREKHRLIRWWAGGYV